MVSDSTLQFKFKKLSLRYSIKKEYPEFIEKPIKNGSPFSSLVSEATVVGECHLVTKRLWVQLQSGHVPKLQV